MTALAEPVTINNYYSGANAPQQANQPANSNQSNTADIQRPGTYYSDNPHGGLDTTYTTGDKTPYMIDNSSNQQQIQPYVYVNPQPAPPGPPGPMPHGR